MPEQQLIEAAYKALVKLYHPDVYKGDKKGLKRKIIEINEAFDTLNDPLKRKQYDIKLKKFQVDKSFDFIDEEFEDKNLFNNKYIDEDWEIALLVYPELEKSLLELLHNSGYPNIKFDKKVNFEELYNKKFN